MATTFGTVAGGRLRATPGVWSARAAAAQVARTAIVLGALGLGASLFAVVRLFDTWQIGRQAHAHVVTLLGVRMSYPMANVEAAIILALALVGFLVTVLAVTGAVRELLGAHRFERALASMRPGRLGEVFVIADAEPQAFCAGLLRPRVYVSSGAIARLDPAALHAVLLHEHHHARRRDPLRTAAGRVVAGSLFFVPWLRALHRHERAMAELGADESAMNAAPQNRSALARAMLSFADGPGAGGGVDPVRVDQLLGEPLSWSFPALLCAASVLAIGLLVAVALLAGELAAGQATFALPFLSGRPCIVVLALIPVTAGVLAGSRPGRGQPPGASSSRSDMRGPVRRIARR